MNIARSAFSLSFAKTICVLAICVGVELFASIVGVLPGLERRFLGLAEKYDAYFPEITIQDGRASIREKQPYYVDNVQENGLVFVIDTTISSYDDAVKLLKHGPYGVALTRSAIVNKDGDQIKVVSLTQVPDMVINSDNIKKAIERLSPIIRTWGLAFLAVCFVITKLVQALALAAIPFFGVRLFRAFITFEQAFKLAAVCMVVPVGINLFLSFSEMGITTMLMVYYAAFVATLIIATRGYVGEMKRAA